VPGPVLLFCITAQGGHHSRSARALPRLRGGGVAGRSPWSRGSTIGSWAASSQAEPASPSAEATGTWMLSYPSRGAARRATAPADLAAGGDRQVLRAVHVQHHQPTGRLAEVDDLGDGLLTAIAALGGVHRGAQQIQLMGEAALIDLVGGPGPVIGDPHRLP